MRLNLHACDTLCIYHNHYLIREASRWKNNEPHSCNVRIFIPVAMVNQSNNSHIHRAPLRACCSDSVVSTMRLCSDCHLLFVNIYSAPKSIQSCGTNRPDGALYCCDDGTDLFMYIISFLGSTHPHTRAWHTYRSEWRKYTALVTTIQS